MSTIVLRSVKGSPLTNTEVDTNFSNLNTDKVEKTAAAITGGTINGTSVGATTASTGAFTSLTATSGVVSANSTGDALRITQTGTGNALLVEDAANPDSTPVVIDADGNTVFGNTTTFEIISAQTGAAASTRLQYATIAGANSSTFAIGNFSTSGTTVSPVVAFAKSKSGVVGTQAILADGDRIGLLDFQGSDGTQFVRAARIEAYVDGTPGTSDMPGRLTFSTTADGASVMTERVRITSAGKTGFATAAPAATVHVAGDTILSNVNVIGASYDSVSFSVAGEELTPTDLFFSPDGLKMYIIGSTGDDVNEYNLSTAWVVSSAVYSTVFSVSQDATPQGLFFRADGTKMYMLGATNDAVFQYTLSTPWSVATASYDSISFSVAGQETTPTAIYFRPNGLSMYVVGNANDAVYQYTLSTAWNVSTATLLQSFSISGQEVTSTGMAFTGDGSRMFITGSTGDDVNVYNLTTPWDISTSAFVGVFSVSGQDTSPGGIYIKPDGTKMYMVGSTNDTVYQYTVPSIDIQLTGPTSAAALDVQQDLNVYGNTTGSFLNNGFRENIGGQYYNLVSQADIGTAPNEIPLNQYLGNLAYQDAANIAGPVGVGGALTLNSGTANGVAYLNGSKVLTTGSALTFDGTNFATTGSGTLKNLLLSGGTLPGAGNPSIALRSSDNVIYHQSGSANTIVMLDSAQNTMQSIGATAQIWNISNSEQMRLTSTGLGIGTSSPGAKLDVSTGIRVNSSGTLTSGFVNAINMGTWDALGYNSAGTAVVLGGYRSSQFTEVHFYGGGSERMRLDSSGNLGLGVTPSAWDSTFKALQVPGGALAGYGPSQTQLLQNAYYNANWKYTATAAASRYGQDSGAHFWYTAPSGTAGDAISFTQAMTLDASGNLGVGTTSPVAPLTVNKGNVTGAGQWASSAIAVANPTNVGAYSQISFGYTVGTTNASAYIGFISTNQATNGFGDLVFGTRAVSTDTQPTERARITSGGDFLVKTVDARIGSDVGSVEYGTSTANSVRFYSSDLERARIDSSGNFMVGQTSTNRRFAATHNVANFTAEISNSNGTPYGIYVLYTGAAPNNTESGFIQAVDTAGLKFEVRSNGGIGNFSGNNVNLSDRREKTNFAPAKSYLETICAIPVQTFNYIDQNMEEDPGLTLGVVAQDVQSVAPELVMESNWGTEEEPKMRLSIYQTDLQYALMKALQELKAEFDAYKASHP